MKDFIIDFLKKRMLSISILYILEITFILTISEYPDKNKICMLIINTIFYSYSVLDFIDLFFSNIIAIFGLFCLGLITCNYFNSKPELKLYADKSLEALSLVIALKILSYYLLNYCDDVNVVFSKIFEWILFVLALLLIYIIAVFAFKKFVLDAIMRQRK